MSNIALERGNIDTSHDGVLSGKRDLCAKSAWIMIMCLASTGGEKTNTHRHWMPLGREGTTSDPTTNTALTMLNGDTMQKIKLGRRVKDKSNTSSELLWHSWFLKAGENNTTGYVENTTYDETIDIMNPYVAVYIWRRTA